MNVSDANVEAIYQGALTALDKAHVAAIKKHGHDDRHTRNIADACRDVREMRLEAGMGATPSEIAPAASKPPATLPAPAVEQPVAHTPGPAGMVKMSRADSRASGFTGDECLSCGMMMMVRNGTCLKCSACGTTTGCS